MVVPSLAFAALLAQAEPAPLPAPFTPRVTPYGFINFQYSRTDATSPKADTSTFEFRRARIGLKGDLTPQVGFNIVYDGADSSLKDAYAALKYLPGVEVRLGQLKTPFGYEQPEADTRLLWLYNSYAVAALARGRDSRDEGVLVSGKWRMGDLLAVDVAAAGVNGAGPSAKDDLVEKTLWGRAGLSLSLAGTTTRLGGSYGHGHQVQSTGADARFGVQGSGGSATLDDTYFYFHAAGADLTFDSPWVFVAAEWVQSRRHVARYTAPAASTVTDVTPKGWYVGAYGKTPWGLGPVLRVEEARLVTSAGTTLAADWNRRYTVGAYYDVRPVNARLVLNYERDASPTVVRTGDRFIALAQVIF